MATRTYAQYCGLARSLDVLGERWTLLVLRELLPGPRRFSDLLDALPGISTGLLTARLRRLQAEGLVGRRRLPPPAGSNVYELTGAGRELEPVLLGLVRWGLARLGPPTAGQVFRPRWAMVAIQAAHDPSAAEGLDQTYTFEVGDEEFHVRVHDGRIEVRDGAAEAPDVTVRADPDVLLRLAGDPGVLTEALRSGGLAVEGAPEAVAACSRLFAGALS